MWNRKFLVFYTISIQVKFKNLLIKQHEYYLNKLDLPKRRTEIKDVDIEKISIENKISDMFLTVDKFGYLKQTLEEQQNSALNVYKNILKRYFVTWINLILL